MYTDYVVNRYQKEREKEMKKVMKLEVLASGTNVVKGKGSWKYVVCFKVVEGDVNGRDHVNVYPEDWNSEELFNKVVAGALRVGGVYKVEANVVTYRRADGTLGSGLKGVRPAK